VSKSTTLTSGQITNHEEITVILIEPSDGTPALVRVHWPLRPHDRRGNALLCCGGGDRQDHRRKCHGTGTTQGGRTMSNDLKAFLISAGGLLAVAGCTLLMLWAALH
jgi:hypothetical protein